jgi:uncharacterized protein
MKFQIFKSKKNKQWYFRLVARNGKIVAQSEGYKGKHGAKNGVASIQKGAANAKIVELILMQ